MLHLHKKLTNSGRMGAQSCRRYPILRLYQWL